MRNTNKCWDCAYCERIKQYNGKEIVTTIYGNCLNWDSPFYKGDVPKLWQPDINVIVPDCNFYIAKTTK